MSDIEDEDEGKGKGKGEAARLGAKAVRAYGQ